MTYGPTLLQQLWAEMDRVTTRLLLPEVFEKQVADAIEAGHMVQHDLSSREELIARARGIAYALSLFMVPHFKSEDDIVREAAKRVRAKYTEDNSEPGTFTPYETPGLGSLVYQPPPGDNKYARTESAKPPAPKVRTIPPHLTPANIRTIKDSPMPVPLLCTAFDVTPEDIELIKSQ